MLVRLEDYAAKQRKKFKAMKSGGDSALSALNDRVECVRTLANVFDSARAMLTAIDELFTDDKPAGKVVLSSVHRSKGLEADAVVLLDPGLMPRGRSTVAYQQSVNLLYVALTRAKTTLVLCDKDPSVKRPPTPDWLDQAAAGYSGRATPWEDD